MHEPQGPVAAKGLKLVRVTSLLFRTRPIWVGEPAGIDPIPFVTSRCISAIAARCRSVANWCASPVALGSTPAVAFFQSVRGCL